MKTDKIIIEGYIRKSQQNGGVFNPVGICPTITCGQHGGCEPKIIVNERDLRIESEQG